MESCSLLDGIGSWKRDQKKDIFRGNFLIGGHDSMSLGSLSFIKPILKNFDIWGVKFPENYIIIFLCFISNSSNCLSYLQLFWNTELSYFYLRIYSYHHIYYNNYIYICNHQKYYSNAPLSYNYYFYKYINIENSFNFQSNQIDITSLS